MLKIILTFVAQALQNPKIFITGVGATIFFLFAFKVMITFIIQQLGIYGTLLQVIFLSHLSSPFFYILVGVLSLGRWASIYEGNSLSPQYARALTKLYFIVLYALFICNWLYMWLAISSPTFCILPDISNDQLLVGVEFTLLSGAGIVSRKGIKTRKKNLFKDYSCFKKGTIILTDDNINQLINSFWNDIFMNNKDNLILIQLRVKGSFSHYSLSRIQCASYKDKEELTRLLVKVLHKIYERYTQFDLNGIYLRYAILPEGVGKPTLNSEVRDTKEVKVLTELDLPTSLDLGTWGIVNEISPSLTLVKAGDDLFTIEKSDDTRNITFVVNSGSAKGFKFTDSIISLESDEFNRTMDNGRVIYYKGGQQVMVYHPQKDAVFIEKLPKDKIYKFEAITLDLETQRLSNGDLRVI